MRTLVLSPAVRDYLNALVAAAQSDGALPAPDVIPTGTNTEESAFLSVMAPLIAAAVNRAYALRSAYVGATGTTADPSQLVMAGGGTLAQILSGTAPGAP